MKYPIIILAAFVMAACASEPKQDVAVEPEVVVLGQFYGDTITVDGALPVEQLISTMGSNDSLHAKVTATINESCKVKGCWMTVAMADGGEMRVNFKDYSFFVPTSGLNGKTAILEGYAYTDTISVAHLKHLAEDAGKTPEEIEAINTPEIGVNFEASGVIILD